MHKLSVFLFLFLIASGSFFCFSQEDNFKPIDISFDLLPDRFNFMANQTFYYNVTGWRFEKPVVTIRYTDSKGTKHEQLVTTQNTRVK